MIYPPWWPAHSAAELIGSGRTGFDRFSSVEKAIREWRGLDPDLQTMARLMVEPALPVGREGQLVMNLGYADIWRLADILGL